MCPTAYPLVSHFVSTLRAGRRMPQGELVVPRTRFVAELAEVFGGYPGKPTVLHTHSTALGVVDALGRRDEMLASYWSALREAAAGAPLIFPTFNYDYLRTGIYTVADDPCRVGALNEYARTRYPHRRTRTPVFHFCLPDEVSDIGLDPVSNPFGGDSLFARLVTVDAVIAFLGAPFTSNTFLHHVEEVCGVGYRYLKPFPGTVVAPDGHRTSLVSHYRVRPMRPGAVDYDWPRLTDELRRRGILRQHRVGRGTVLSFSAARLFDHWTAALRQDEFYLLTPRSRAVVAELADQYGYPLCHSRLEPNHA